MNAEDSLRPDATCDGGDLDCGSGLLLIIRNAMQPLPRGGLLEVRSREISVKEDLPAWCRLVGHTLVAVQPGEGTYTHYYVRKQQVDEALKTDTDKARAFVWSARVRWTGGMHARAFIRNHSFDVGQPASFDTQDIAPSAVEYLLAALGGCLAVGFQWRASHCGRVAQLAEFIAPERIYLNPDCGFGTFADRPVATPDVTFKKLQILSQAAKILRGAT
jgi:TusA-related sulfurtransferase